MVYLAFRNQAKIFRGGEKSTSDAIRAGTASWAIDEETALMLRANGVEFVGFWCRDSGDKYVTRLDRFYSSKAVRIMNYEGRGGALQRYLPLSEFRFRPGRGKL